MKIPVGKHAAKCVFGEVCIQKKCSAHAALADLPIDQYEQLLFSMDPRSS